MRRVGLDHVGDQRREATSDRADQLSHACNKNSAQTLAMLTRHNDEQPKTDPTCGKCNSAALRTAPTDLLSTTTNTTHDTDSMLGCDDPDAGMARPRNRPTHSQQ